MTIEKYNISFSVGIIDNISEYGWETERDGDREKE